MNKYLEIKNIFEKNRNDESAIAMANYMQNNFLFYGIDAKNRKELEKDFIKKEKANKKIDYEFLKQCFDDDYREMQYFVLDYLDSLSKYIVISDLNDLEYFVKNKQWWDTIDKVDKLIGNIDCNNKVLDDLMIKWSKHSNMWYRRLSIDHQQNRKDKTNSNLLEQIIVNNLGSDEFFINKAIGWSLREYSKYNPNWVKDFLNKYSSQMSNLSIKEASKLF